MPVGCSPAAMGPMTFLVDPGKYDYHNCEQLAEQRKKAFQLATKSAGRRPVTKNEVRRIL
jgi:translation initiation factor IF-3